VSDHIAELWERNAQDYLKTNVPHNPYYPFTTHAEYIYIQGGIKVEGMKKYYDNVLKVENTVLGFPNFDNGDGVQKLGASKPEDQALREWELDTLEDMRCNDNHQLPITYWSHDIIKSMRCWTRRLAHAEHLIYAPHCCINSDMAPQ
jgi:hypothetical protein